MKRSLLVFVFLLSGCATITSNGGKQNVSIASTPTGASISVNGNDKGVTPTIVELQRSNQPVTIKVSKDGYKPQEFQPSRITDPMFFGNIIFGGFIGTTTDAATGNINKFDRDSYLITLEPEAGPPTRVFGAVTDVSARTREFILVSFANLALEISNGSGPYLETLFSLLRIPTHQRKETLERLRATLVVYPNIMDFADAVVQLFVAREGARLEATPPPPPRNPINLSGRDSDRLSSIVTNCDQTLERSGIPATCKTASQDNLFTLNVVFKLASDLQTHARSSQDMLLNQFCDAALAEGFRGIFALIVNQPPMKTVFDCATTSWSPWQTY
jgi:hypothetical protein